MDTMKEYAFPLLVANEKEKLVVTDLRGGRQFKDKCINQGIVPGQKIEILSIGENSPCLVIVNDSRVMIGYNMLNRILVRKE